jgi:uncharacterized protein YecE (DUF72 family)
MMSDYRVYLGAVGWAHPEWEGNFYPEDLPEEWQLPFYNTQFRCVYLPYELWRKASDEEVAAWLYETQDGFRFVLQLPEKADEETRRLAKRFGERGIPEQQIDLFWLGGESDLRDLAKHMQKAAQMDSPLFLISRDGALTQLRQLGELMEVLGV